MSNLVLVDNLTYRIKYCEEAERNVLQVLMEDNEWLCLHENTLEEEHEAMTQFINKYPEGTLHGNVGIVLGDLLLVKGHLVSPEMHIDITLWSTDKGDVVTPVLITQD